MSTAEELLCSRKWRLAHGLWMLWGWVPFALTAWIGYLTIGIKARNWRWIVTSVAFFIFGAVWVWTIGWIGEQTSTPKGQLSPEPYRTYMNVAMWSSIILWLGNAAGLQWWINRKWLVWRAHNNKRVSTPWYATATAAAGGPSSAERESQRVASVMDNAIVNGSASSTPGATQPALVATPSPPPVQSVPNAPSPGPGRTPAALNLNTATEAELAVLPGFDIATAAQVVAARGEIGVFRDTTELVTRAGVKPHVLVGLQGRITVVGPADAVTPSVEPRAVPTRDSGRRLEF